MAETLDDIKPDTIETLTAHLHRLFRYAGCDPACHACHKEIEIGAKFQLATHTKEKEKYGVEPKPSDVMLCEACNLDDLRKEDARQYEAWRKRPGGYVTHTRLVTAGYSRPTRAKP